MLQDRACINTWKNKWKKGSVGCDKYHWTNLPLSWSYWGKCTLDRKHQCQQERFDNQTFIYCWPNPRSSKYPHFVFLSLLQRVVVGSNKSYLCPRWLPLQVCSPVLCCVEFSKLERTKSTKFSDGYRMGWMFSSTSQKLCNVDHASALLSCFGQVSLMQCLS